MDENLSIDFCVTAMEIFRKISTRKIEKASQVTYQVKMHVQGPED